MHVNDQIERLGWGRWEKIPTKARGWMEVRSIDRPAREFWNLWREHKDQMKAAGINVFNRTGEPDGWRVEQWVMLGQRPRVLDLGGRRVIRRPLHFKGTIYRRW